MLQCCQVRGLPPKTWYLAPEMRILTAETPKNFVCFYTFLPVDPLRNMIGLVLGSNWAGFVVKTWQPLHATRRNVWKRIYERTLKQYMEITQAVTVLRCISLLKTLTLKEQSTFFGNRLILQLPKSLTVDFYHFWIHSADLRVWR